LQSIQREAKRGPKSGCKKSVTTLTPKFTLVQITSNLDELERKLPYRDIRFYRSIALTELGKEREYQKQREAKLAEEQNAQQGGTWLGWIWGSAPTAQTSLHAELDDDQRRELYAAVDFDERAVLAESFETNREYQKANVSVKLERGSFALFEEADSGGILSTTFTDFSASFIQRPENFEGQVSLGDLSVFNNFPVAEPFRQMLRVQDVNRNREGHSDPFFYVKFENKPLDQRADTALTMRLRHTEIIYHKTTLEKVHRFFKPPGAQPELVDVFYVSHSPQTIIHPNI
jgi:vacuolar protein sorting-associated protein 13A/C